MSALIPDSFDEANKISKMIPNLIDSKPVTYSMMCDIYNNPESYPDLGHIVIGQVKRAMEALKEIFDKYPEVHLALDKLRGVIAGTGLHAGGVVVSSKPLHDYVPIMEGSDTAVLPVLQQEMGDLDFHKCLKIDALGLLTLQQVRMAMDLTNLDYDWFDKEDFSDPKVYEMLRNGDTTDVFQMSSFTATKMLRDFKVKNFEDLGIVNAGNRPGPTAKNKDTNKSMVDIYKERNDTGNIPSIDPRIDHILELTNGCIW